MKFYFPLAVLIYSLPLGARAQGQEDCINVMSAISMGEDALHECEKRNCPGEILVDNDVCRSNCKDELDQKFEIAIAGFERCAQSKPDTLCKFLPDFLEHCSTPKQCDRVRHLEATYCSEKRADTMPPSESNNIQFVFVRIPLSDPEKKCDSREWVITIRVSAVPPKPISQPHLQEVVANTLRLRACEVNNDPASPHVDALLSDVLLEEFGRQGIATVKALHLVESHKADPTETILKSIAVKFADGLGCTYTDIHLFANSQIDLSDNELSILRAKAEQIISNLTCKTWSSEGYEKLKFDLLMGFNESLPQEKFSRITLDMAGPQCELSSDVKRYLGIS